MWINMSDESKRLQQVSKTECFNDTYSSPAVASRHSVCRPVRCQQSSCTACPLGSHNHTCTSSWPPRNGLAALETCCRLQEATTQRREGKRKKRHIHIQTSHNGVI